MTAAPSATDDARPPFHLAFPVHDLAAARAFYGGLLGCPEGRSSDHWVDFDLAGHQIVAHLVERDVGGASPVRTSDVDGDAVPTRHFGLVLEWSAWEALAERLRAAETRFLVGPRVRFTGQPGEQATLFIEDPSGNALEFKAFRDPSRLFARE
jgi:extradiol dioxygenase family protein